MLIRGCDCGAISATEAAWDQMTRLQRRQFEARIKTCKTCARDRRGATDAPAKGKPTISSLRGELTDAQVDLHHYRERYIQEKRRADRLEVTVIALQNALIQERHRFDQMEEIPF
jgi:hypothetical protein